MTYNYLQHNCGRMDRISTSEFNLMSKGPIKSQCYQTYCNIEQICQKEPYLATLPFFHYLPSLLQRL